MRPDCAISSASTAPSTPWWRRRSWPRAIHLLPAADILTEFRRLAILVDKTGGAQEQEAFAFLSRFVERGGLPEGGAA